MTRQDRELLNKQLGWATPKPRGNGALVLAILGVFVAGIVLGRSLPAHDGEPVSASPKVSVAFATR